MKFIFFDTETTGLVSFKHKHSDPCQPHLVQLAALLTTDTGEEISSFSALVDPRGWYASMPVEASAAHGITYERAIAEGKSLHSVLRKFNSMLGMANLCIAHNFNFDKKVIEVAWTRTSLWPEYNSFNNTACTMQITREILKLPPTARMIAAKMPGSKSPKLSEAYEYLLGHPLVGTHDALVDTRACAEVFFAARAFNNERLARERAARYQSPVA